MLFLMDFLGPIRLDSPNWGTSNSRKKREFSLEGIKTAYFNLNLYASFNTLYKLLCPFFRSLKCPYISMTEYES